MRKCWEPGKPVHIVAIKKALTKESARIKRESLFKIQVCFVKSSYLEKSRRKVEYIVHI